MMLQRDDLSLYAVTDRRWLQGQSLYNAVESAIKGGITCLQLREKDLNYDDFLAEAKDIHNLCQAYKIPLIINDNIKLALAIGATAVHLGQQDGDLKNIKHKLGKIQLGVSAHNVEEAKLAETMGADYLGVGAVFGSSTKLDTQVLSFEELKAICEAVRIPVVAIGGINQQNVLNLKGSKIAGVAVVSAIFAASDIEQATASLKQTLATII